MRRTYRPFLVACALGAAVACSSGDTSDDRQGSHADAAGDPLPTQDAGDDAPRADADQRADTDAGEPDYGPAVVLAAHADLLGSVTATLDDPQYFAGGTWLQHYGDAAMYGPSFDLAWWTATGDEGHLARARAALDADAAIVQAASDDILGSLEHLEDVAMALLGLLEAGQYIDDSDYLATAERFMEQVDTLAATFGDYVSLDAGEFAADTYGPTAISSFVALMHLEYALAHPDLEAEAHIARAAEVLDHVHDRAWDEALGAYRFTPEDDRLMLYPNITMMVAYGRALQLTGDAKFRDRISAIYEGIQPLRDPAGDHFHSPYSAEYMGATDPDYSTLSSQNYLMMGLWLSYVGTGDDRFLRDLDGILGFLETRLLVEERLLHHWMNGRAAIPTDPEYFCSGCNLQALYVMMMLRLYTAPGA